jgi:signal peptidase complex subunit 2
MQYLSRPELFKQIHQHTDVRLALGWLSVFVAGGTGLYGYKVEFEQSKPVVWAGLILCVMFSPFMSSVASTHWFIASRRTVPATPTPLPY